MHLKKIIISNHNFKDIIFFDASYTPGILYNIMGYQNIGVEASKVGSETQNQPRHIKSDKIRILPFKSDPPWYLTNFFWVYMFFRLLNSMKLSEILFGTFKVVKTLIFGGKVKIATFLTSLHQFQTPSIPKPGKILDRIFFPP